MLSFGFKNIIKSLIIGFLFVGIKIHGNLTALYHFILEKIKIMSKSNFAWLLLDISSLLSKKVIYIWNFLDDFHLFFCFFFKIWQILN